MFIRTETYAGLDWHDICSDNCQILLNGSPDIFDTDSVIFADIKNALVSLEFMEASKLFSFDAFLNLKEKPFKFETPEEYRRVIIEHFADKDYHLNADLDNGFEYSVYYHVYDVKNPVYIPVAKYLYGIKYGDSQERFFCKDYFTDYKEAKAFMYRELASRNPELAIDQYDDYQIFVFDKEKLLEMPWYQHNKAIMEKMKHMDKNEYKKMAIPYLLHEYKNLCENPEMENISTDNK